MIPRIEVTSIFSGSAPGEIRHRDFDYYRCNDSYYDISFAEADEKCKELFGMAGTLIHGGATRKSSNLTPNSYLIESSISQCNERVLLVDFQIEI